MELGRSFAWRTTSGIDAEGGRIVEPLGEDRCRFTFHVRVTPRAASERLLEPVLGWLLRRAVRTDIRRLASHCASHALHSQDTLSPPKPS